MRVFVLQFGQLVKLIQQNNDLKEYLISFKVGAHMVSDLIKHFTANADFKDVKEVDHFIFEKSDNKQIKPGDQRIKNTEHIVSWLCGLRFQLFWPVFELGKFFFSRSPHLPTS